MLIYTIVHKMNCGSLFSREYKKCGATEAGMIDGANPWQKFWKLTFPMLLPFVSINLILSTKNMMMVFDQIMSLTKGPSGRQAVLPQIYEEM